MKLHSAGRGALCACLALVFGVLLASQAYAQVAGGTLSGTVTDSSGAVIPGARVSIRNASTGVTREVTTDAEGFYTAPNLLPGTYEITLSASGFSTEVRSGITLTVGAEQELNVVMRVGAATEKVEVTGEAPAVQLATSSLSAVVDSTTVRELPLNGRSWTDLTNLQPGVSAIQTQPALSTGVNRGNRGFGAQVTISGARPQMNNYRLDGISINDYTNGAPGSVLGGNLGVDAIQEFSVLTSNYSAEYGRTSGGVVNAITRSGTNQFHGAAYEFLRNSSLDARNFFDNNIPTFRRNQFGAEAGGPIRKDKAFIFGDYEAIRQSLGVTSLNTVPSVAARNGMLCSAPDTSTGCTPTTITVDPSAQKYLPLWSPPNEGIRPGSNGDIGLFAFAGQQVIKENFATIRFDDKLSDRNSLAVTYLGDATPFTGPDPLGNVLIKSETNRQIATLEETHIFSAALVNSARLGYSRDGVLNGVNTSALNALASDPSLAAVPGQLAAQVTVSGLTTEEAGVRGLGYNAYYWNSYQGYDDAFWTHGTHSVKFGGAVERMDFNFINLINPSGAFTFSSLTKFLTNEPKRLQLGFPASSTPRGLRETLFGLYVQDDWRARPNLTLNAGLRWEMATVPTEVQNKIASLINITDAAPRLGAPFFSNPTRRDFEPRVGFSWDPFRNGKTAVRGGFGIFDWPPMPMQFDTLMQAYPFFVIGQVNKLPAGSFFTGALPLVKPASNREAYLEQHPPRDYVMQWNLNMQRELPGSLTATVGYVGSHGVHLPLRVDDIDMVIPTLTPQGYLFPSPVASGTTINPNFGTIRGMFNQGLSSYNALQVSTQKRISHGVQFQSSFTWGKSMDTGSATDHGDQFSNSISSWWTWFNPGISRAVSDFDIGRTFVFNAIWEVPGLKSVSGPAGWITRGWQLGGIYTASDGAPFTPTFGTDGDPLGLNSSDPWDFPNRVVGPGCGSLINPGNATNYIRTQCFAIPTAPSLAFYTANCDPSFGTSPQCFNLRGNAGRNIMTGPGLSNLDFSLFKNNPVRRISENFNVQFRAEFFNILNRANFSPPVTPDNTDIFDSSGAPTGVAGLLTSTTTTAREIQFAIKLIW